MASAIEQMLIYFVCYYLLVVYDCSCFLSAPQHEQPMINIHHDNHNDNNINNDHNTQRNSLVKNDRYGMQSPSSSSCSV